MSVPPSESIPLQRIDSGTKSTSWDEPLVGLPAKAKVDDQMLTFGPHLPAHRAAEAYCKSVGITIPFPKTYQKLNKERAQRIAQLYDDLVSTPDAPEAIAAYEALCKETMARWEFIKKTGLQVEFSPSEQPYSNPRTAILDITQNNHFYVTSTRGACGQGGIDPNDTNPLLAETDEIISGEKALINDIFRIVHDFFGHAKEGLGFRSRSWGFCQSGLLGRGRRIR